jgi:formylmethanofuran dehydrogenase subunit E
MEIPSFDEVARFHGHRCPGLALGYRAAEAGLAELSVSRPADEELVCIVENDACGVDAVQYAAGCTLGKGNLIYRDYGKHAYTFLDRRTGKAVRVSQRPEFSSGRIDPRASELRAKVNAGTATSEEQREYRSRSDQVIAAILSMPAAEIFTIRSVSEKPPEEARIFSSVPCARCGELVSESRARICKGKVVCIPCSEEYTRGW